MSRHDSSCESWAPWHEDSFKLDSPPAAAISRSLWDEIPPHEEEDSASDPHSLFTSTPATDITGVMLSSFSHQDIFEAHCSEEEEADCPLQKRRRMLLFSQDEDIKNPTWYLNAENADNSITSFDQQQSAAQESWMSSWFNSDSEDQKPSRCIQVPDSHNRASEISNEEPPPRSSRSLSFASNKSTSVTDRKSTPRPVAYPFALLKPCGVTGDVTLSDINQRIQTRPKQIRRVKLEEGTSASEGAGLSGKSVVALTKIHTEGNGSITIMRTKG